VRYIFSRLRGAGLLAICVLMCATLIAGVAEAGSKRVALVIGNGAYQSVPQLPNPKKDAEAVSLALRKQGFEVVTAVDLSRVELEKAVERYTRALNGAEISLFYYSGHGIEVGGENRIIPIDAMLKEPQELETQTFSLQTILLYMQSNSQAQLLYLDACRDNPFSDRAFLLGADDTEKPAGKGLAEQKSAVGSLIAYATEPGNIALDGKGDNSPFTQAVIKHSFTQDVDVQSALMQVTADVYEATNKSQRPWINSSLVKPIFLNGLAKQIVATNVPPLTKTLAEIQSTETTRGVEAGPVTIGAGPQSVFSEETAQALPNAKAYKLMQMPVSGTLSIDDQVLSEGAVIDFAKFKTFKFEPSTDVQVFKDANTSALLVPAINVETVAMAADGTALPVQIKIQQRMHECDLLAAEPLDFQSVGNGVELDKIDVSQALIACQKAVEEHPENIRYVYLLGRAQLSAGNAKAALPLIQKAADAGYVRANHQLGLMATQGIGMDINLELANTFFKLAADKGDPLALLAFGSNLVKGIGMKADPKQGIAILKHAAELGNTDALDEMGSLYLYGGVVKASPKRAAGFYDASITRSVQKKSRRKSVAFGGHPTAPTDIGALYFNGNGVPKDLRQAIKWYERGAEHGNQGGAADLSFIFANGPDELRNPTKAVWYTSLALATEGLAGNAELLQRLAGLPDDAKRSALRDFVNLVGPCASNTTDGLDDTLVLLSGKAWLQRQSDAGEMALPSVDGSFAQPDGTGPADELKYWNLVNEAGSDEAYLAYLDAFPDGIFADIARNRLGGLLERVKPEPQVAACEPLPLVKQPKKKSEPAIKRPIKKADPVRPRPAPPVVKPVRPRPIVEKPVRRPPTRVKPPRPPKLPKRPPVIIDEEPPVIDEEPDFNEPPRRPKFKLKLRLPKFEVPQDDNPCPRGGCNEG
jgi:uncharacterized caspase-like protein/TPR repeat protein